LIEILFCYRSLTYTRHIEPTL